MKRMTAMILAAILMMMGMAAAFGEENKVWQLGDTGETVTRIQERLIELEYMEGEATGVFDEATKDALARFQKDQGLMETGKGDAVTLMMLWQATKHARKADAEIDVIEDGWYWEATEADSYAPTGNYMALSTSAPVGGYAKGYFEMPEFDTNEYTRITSNRFLSAKSNPLSTFAADVDTSSYSQFRRRVLDGEKVAADSIRIEELLNYFHYDYKQPEGDDPFGVTVEYANCPWNEKTKLLQIGFQAKTVDTENRPGYNLVFLIDTSGSMDGSDRLDLVKRAFLMLLDELGPQDTVSIVAYASQDRVVIEGVPASEKTRIMEAITELQAHGATNGGAGILRAYEVAERYFKDGGVNRILLATDGDLNVGVTSEGELVRLVEEKRKSGISLTCMGFGMGNYKDNKMEALADYGNGNCWYIDTIHEARKALVTEGGGTFVTVAKDVKIQVDFNPEKVKGYRLIGYEDRLMAAEDFANDEKDGGELGSGHRMTVLYEIVPADSDFDFGEAESRYQNAGEETSGSTEMLTVSIRAKEPDGDVSKLYEYPVDESILAEQLSDNMKFAAAVAEVGMVLRDSEWKGSATFGTAQELLRDCGSIAGDTYKEEFVYLVNLLSREQESQY